MLFDVVSLVFDLPCVLSTRAERGQELLEEHGKSPEAMASPKCVRCLRREVRSSNRICTMISLDIQILRMFSSKSR